MAITFFNVKTGEKRTVDTEPMIAAFFNSSDQHVNALVGQDMGWRIGAETIRRIKEIEANPSIMDRIAASFQLPSDGVSRTDVLRWISLEDARKEAEATQNQESDYTRQYEADVAALEQENRIKNDPNPSQPAGASKLVPNSQDEHTFTKEGDKIEKSSKVNKEK